jgi:hypothetical protein
MIPRIVVACLVAMLFSIKHLVCAGCFTISANTLGPTGSVYKITDCVFITLVPVAATCRRDIVPGREHQHAVLTVLLVRFVTAAGQRERVDALLTGSTGSHTTLSHTIDSAASGWRTTFSTPAQSFATTALPSSMTTFVHTQLLSWVLTNRIQSKAHPTPPTAMLPRLMGWLVHQDEHWHA